MQKGVAIIIRGASQPFKFKMPYDFEEPKTLRITFWQKDNVHLGRYQRWF